MTKSISLPDKNIETTILSLKLDIESSSVSASTHIWLQFGYFNRKPTNFNMRKVSYLANSIIYVNHVYLTVKNNRKCIIALFYSGTNRRSDQSS